MKKIIRLTESELISLVKGILNDQSTDNRLSTKPTKKLIQLSEEKLSSLISESMVQAQAAIADAKGKMSSGKKPDPNTMGKIKQCITNKQLTSLMFLTTGAGAFALGTITMLIAGGAVSGGSTSVVGFALGGTMALSSILVLFITGLSEKDGGLGADPSRDVKALLSCMGI